MANLVYVLIEKERSIDCCCDQRMTAYTELEQAEAELKRRYDAFDGDRTIYNETSYDGQFAFYAQEGYWDNYSIVWSIVILNVQGEATGGVYLHHDVERVLDLLRTVWRIMAKWDKKGGRWFYNRRDKISKLITDIESAHYAHTGKPF